MSGDIAALVDVSDATELGRRVKAGELKAGELVLVKTEGEGKAETFTFTGTPHPGSLDLPVVETVGDAAEG